MQFKALKYPQEIAQAQALLHQVYMEEMGWVPDIDNPSKLKIKVSDDQRYLTDKYDAHAYWFGIYVESELVACWRLCPPVDGKFELEEYNPIPERLTQSKSLEITRLAIRADYRRSRNVLFQLASRTMGEVMDKFDYTFAATQFPNPGTLYLRLGATKVEGSSFKYSIKDDQDVSLLYFDLKDKTTLLFKRLSKVLVTA